MAYHMTSGRSREPYAGIREHGWKCTCGKRSGWFPSVGRRDASATRHRATH